MWYTGLKNKRIFIVDKGDELYKNDCEEYRVVVVDTSSSYIYYNLLCMGDRYMAATMRMESQDFKKKFSPLHDDPMTGEELKEEIKKKRIEVANLVIFFLILMPFSCISTAVCLAIFNGADSYRGEWWHYVIVMVITIPLAIFSGRKMVKDMTR